MGLLDRIWPTKKIAITEQAPTHPDKAKALAQLQESFNQNPDMFSQMFDRYYSNGTWWLPSGGGMPALGGTSNKTQGRDQYNFFTEQDLRFQRDAARMLFGREPTAKGIEGHLNAFVVGSGFTYRIMPKKEYEETFNLETLATYQQALDDWMIEQAWPQREQECYTCQVVDGEWFLWVTVSDGKVQIRRIEPEHIQNKPGSSFKDGWYLGVKVDLMDVETPLAYGYKPDYVEWREIPAAEIVHLKDNVTRNVARGISAFWPVIDDLNNVANLLDNLVAGSAARAEIPYMWSIKNATPAAVTSFADQRTERTSQNPLTGRTDRSKGQKSARAVAHGDNVEFTTMPAGDSDAYIASLQAALRAIGNRWCFPEFFSGDASNGNYASSLVAGGPFVRFVEKVQNNIKPYYQRIMKIVLDNFVATGIIAVNDREKLDIEIGCDSPIIHDELADAQAKDIKMRNGAYSSQEWVQDDGRQWEKTQRNIEEAMERNMQTPNLNMDAGKTAFGAQQEDKQNEDQKQQDKQGEDWTGVIREAWEETKHPRAGDGKFGSGGGSKTQDGKPGIVDLANESKNEIKGHVRDFVQDLQTGSVKPEDFPTYLGGIKAEMESMAKKYGVELSHNGPLDIEIEATKKSEGGAKQGIQQMATDIKSHIKDYAEDMALSKKAGEKLDMSGYLSSIAQSMAAGASGAGVKFQGKHVVEMVDASGHAHVGKGSPEGGQFTQKKSEGGGSDAGVYKQMKAMRKDVNDNRNTPSTTQARAKIGGEEGPNGEWYKGGAFIATTDMPKKVKEKINKAATGKVQTSPSEWEVPEAGKMSIFNKVAGTVYNHRDGSINYTYLDFQKYTNEEVKQFEEIINKMKSGEKWVDVNDYPWLANFSDLSRMAVTGVAIPGDAMKYMPNDVKEYFSKYKNGS